MPLFVCATCGVVENTALSNYWTRQLDARENGLPVRPPECSQCDPTVKQWHGQFERIDWRDYRKKWPRQQLRDLPQEGATPR